jgi:hypothetical protein
LWAVLCFVTSSRTVDMSRSVCRTLLGMYHGAFTVVRNSVVVLQYWIGRPCPIGGIPHVHIGRGNVLYSRSLFSI